MHDENKSISRRIVDFINDIVDKHKKKPEVVEEKLTFDDIKEIANASGLKVNQTVNYVAIKKGNRNVATINNDLTVISIKKTDNKVTISNKKDLEEVMDIIK